jgi:MGT family glycosyltransferase
LRRTKIMQHIGLICPETSGHLNPTATLGRALKNRGYNVSLIAKPDGQYKAKAAGLNFLPLGEKIYPTGSMAQQTARLGEMSGTDGLHYTIELFTEYAQTILREAPDVIRAAGIDALVVDEVTGAASSVAEALGLPFVTISNACLQAESSIPPPFTCWSYDPSPAGCERNRGFYARFAQLLLPYRSMTNAYRREWGLPRVNALSEYLSPLAQITQQPAFFDFPRRELHPCFHYTGPFHDDLSGDAVEFPFDKLNGKPLIYASMGTVQNRLGYIFEMIANACAGFDAQLVISLGCHDQSVPCYLPGNPLVVPYAPQLALLQRATLVITHSGLNTVLETLSQGVPMVAIPITNDQPGVAARLAYIGAGMVVPLDELNVVRLRDAIQQVLTDKKYQRSAQMAQQEIRQINGVQQAADIALQALTTRNPVPRI